MKTFNSLKELLDYCSACPVCKDKREINIAAGPDSKFKSVFYSQLDNKVSLACRFTYGDAKEHSSDFGQIMSSLITRYDINFVIDSATNKYSVAIISKNLFHPVEDILAAIDNEDFCCWAYANCTNCQCSTNTLDVEFNSITKNIFNIGVEQESIWLTQTEHMLHLSLHPKEKNMQVTRLIRDTNGDLLDNSSVIKLPYINLDYSNEERLVTRLRTMMVFS